MQGWREGGKWPWPPVPTESLRRWQEELQPVSSGELVALTVLGHWRDLRGHEVT